MTIPAAFFTSCILVSLIGGFGIKVATTFGRFKDSLTLEASQHEELRAELRAMSNNGNIGKVGNGGNGGKVVLENPMRLATRALAWGTVWAVVGSGAVAISALYMWKL